MIDIDILNEWGYKIIGCGYSVHSNLGPGLLESTYQASLEYELVKNGFKVHREKPLPVQYDNQILEIGYHIDLLVNDEIVLEIKSVEAVADIHFRPVNDVS